MRFKVILMVALGAATTTLAQTEHVQRGVSDDAGLPLLSAGTIDMYTPAVVRLEAAHGQDVRSGAAFFTGPGKLVTSRRLLFGAQSAEVVFDTGDRLPVDSVLADDEQSGLIIASVDVPASLRRGLRVSFLEPLIGDVGIAAGAPTQPGAEEPVHDLLGIKLAARAREGAVKIIKIELLGTADPEAWRKLEGGPVIDNYGQVVGVVSTDLASVRRPTVAVAAAALHKMTETKGMPLAQWSDEGSLASLIQSEHEEALDRQSADLPRPEGFAPVPDDIEGYKVTPAGIEQMPDGSLMLDGRYEMRGSGTPNDPYIVSWDLLVSASDTMMPRVGKKSVPERVAMLDGKWVRIGGNISFPLMMSEPTELLLMLNPWDGCCIGVPPTPYDAVEVALNDPATEDDIYAAYGSIKGRLFIRPYLVGDWLVGLYVLDNASLKVEEFGGVSP